MMSASPAWKPQATLTEVASSIMAASLPISQGPKLSPRSQLRSTVFMLLLASGFFEHDLFGKPVPTFPDHALSRKILPGPGIDGVDRTAGDISIPQGLDVEVEIINAAQPVGQGVQEFRKLFRRGLRLGHADGLEAQRATGRYLREPAEIGGDYGRDLGVAAGGAAVRHQHDRLAVAGYLHAAVYSTVGDDVVTMQMLDARAFEPVTHAVASCRYLPLRVKEQRLGVIGEFVVLRAHHHADRRLADGGKFDPAFRRAARNCHLQFVTGSQRTRVGAAEPGAVVHREAAEHRLARNAALDCEVAKRTCAGKAERQCLAIGKRHRCFECNAS